MSELLLSRARVLALCPVVLACISTQAGTVEQALIQGDPQMQVKDGAIQACGYRLRAFPKSFMAQLTVMVLDTSFNTYSSGLNLLKGGATQVRVKDGKPDQGTTKPIESFWIKAPAGRPTAALNGKVTAASEPKGYLLYGVTTESVAGLFAGVGEGTPITVGVRIKGESIDRIYSGVVQLSDQDKAQGQQCVRDLTKQMEADVAAKPSGR